MRGTLSTKPELFSDLSWNLLLLGEETAKKWGHNEFNIEHVIHTLFSAGEFANFIDKLSIDENIVLDITEDFLEENPEIYSDNFTIGEDLEILLDNANHIKIQWGSNLIEIPHLLIAIARDERLGYYVFEEGNLSIEKLEAELKLHPNLVSKDNNLVSTKANISDEAIRDTSLNDEIGEDLIIEDQVENNNIILNSQKAILQKATTDLEIIPDTETDSALSLYGKDLTEIAKRGILDPVIGREIEINNLMRVLSRRNKNNPILIGNPGVGKTAIIELLAQLITQNKVPQSLQNLKIISLDIGSLVSGTKYRGQLEERMKSILDELKILDQGVILFLDEIHNIINSDRSSTDISGILKPLLTGNSLRCIGITTPDLFRENIEKDAALNRCFQSIFVSEPSVELSSKIINGIKRKYEIHHGIKISREAVDIAAKLSNRYISDRCLPDKAIDLIDEAAAQLKIESSTKPELIVNLEAKLNQINQDLSKINDNKIEIEDKKFDEKEILLEKIQKANDQWQNERFQLNKLSELLFKEDKLIKFIENISTHETHLEDLEKYENDLSELQKDINELLISLEELNKEEKLFIQYIVKPEDIADVVAKITGIPISKVVSNERKKLIDLEKEISQKVIGQDKAIGALSSAIRRARTGMKNPKKPIGSFLFMGPTGVGKTELAKALASSLFDEEDAILRLDMSEYMERNAVARLLGAPPGYVGYEEGGQLTEAVRRKPYSVILLDEIEKAHNEVFNILLQVLDEGRLTDSQGSTIDFKNTVIIMTSNLAGKAILENAQKLNTQRQKTALFNKTLDETINKALLSIFRPEFLNRVDEVIRFEPLSKPQLQKIILLQVEELQKLLLEQDIEIEIDKKVITKIANDAYQPEYGARPLSRELRRQLENPLASKLLASEFQNTKRILIKIHPTKKDMIMFTPS